MLHGSDWAAEIGVGLVLTGLESDMNAITAQAYVQDGDLANLADEIARARRLVAALPTDAAARRELTAGLGLAQARLLRLRGEQDRLWARLEERGDLVADLRVAWAATRRQAPDTATLPTHADLLAASWTRLGAMPNRIGQARALLTEAREAVRRSCLMLGAAT